MLKHIIGKIMSTKRLLLRPFLIEDAEDMFNLWGSDESVSGPTYWKKQENIEKCARHPSDGMHIRRMSCTKKEKVISINIRIYNNKKDREAVLKIYKSSFSADSPHNDPSVSIDRKLMQKDDLFFVADTDNGNVIGTVMVGYDGHRGWIYSLTVATDYRHKGAGSEILKFAEKKLESLGCPKINLQVLATNTDVVKFYKKNGYDIEERISMGKRLY